MLHENLLKARQKLQNTPLLKKVSEPSEIPDLDARAIERINEDPELKKVVVAVYNRMNDPEALAAYSVALADDAAVLMSKSATRREVESLSRGEVTRTAVMKALVARHRAQGNSNFSTIASDRVKPTTRTRKSSQNSSFREAVGQGPFFDKPLKGSRHGVDTHFMQEDYVAAVIFKETGGNPRKFWDFIGSKKGIRSWVPLFDAATNNSLARPEFFAHQVSGVLKITD